MFIASKFYCEDILFMNKTVLENILAILSDVLCIGTDSFFLQVSMYSVTITCN